MPAINALSLSEDKTPVQSANITATEAAKKHATPKQRVPSLNNKVIKQRIFALLRTWSATHGYAHGVSARWAYHQICRSGSVVPLSYQAFVQLMANTPGVRWTKNVRGVPYYALYPKGSLAAVAPYRKQRGPPVQKGRRNKARGQRTRVFTNSARTVTPKGVTETVPAGSSQATDTSALEQPNVEPGSVELQRANS